MWNCRNTIFVLDGRSNGNRTRTLADVHFLEAAVGQGLIDIFAVVRSYINVFRVEFFQFINHIIYLLYAVPFQRR